MKFTFTAIIISLILHSILFIELNNNENSNNEIKVSIKLNRLKSLNPTLAQKITKDIDLPINKTLRPISSSQKSVNQDHLNHYLNSLAIYLQNKIQYPHKAKQLRQEGVVITEFEISSKGKIFNFNLTKPSKHNNLNKHVKLILGQIETLPKPPKNFSTLGLIKINVPIEFKL